MANKIIDWLTENENPMIKYRTLIEILGEPKDGDNRILYNSIWEHKTMVRILQKQDENGLWADNYGSTTFSSLRYLTTFAEYGLEKDERIDRYVDHTVDFLLKNKDELAGCAAPLILRALVMLGYHRENDVMELINKFASEQHYDGGFICKRLLDKKPERKSCYKAAVAGLLLYAECKRKGVLPDNADELIYYFLKRDVFYSSDKSNATFKQGRLGWRFIDNFFPVEPMRMGFPLIISALSILGVGEHPELTESWALLKEKSDENGKLYLEGTLTKQPCNFGKVGQPNKWITFYALLAEKYKKSI